MGLDVGDTSALARLICLEGADESGFQKAERHLAKTGGIAVSARQIQRVAQRVGKDAQVWQGREAKPRTCDAPVLYASADGNIMATIMASHMSMNIVADAVQVCPGIRIHIMDIVQPPGMSIPPPIER